MQHVKLTARALNTTLRSFLLIILFVVYEFQDPKSETQQIAGLLKTPGSQRQRASPYSKPTVCLSLSTLT